MHQLIERLSKDYPKVKFISGESFSWSPSSSSVIYKDRVENPELGSWSLFHELAHALLGHTNYVSDVELLLLEANAWHKAKELAKKYSITIDDNHVQDCLDTYRDWLHKRSSCPVCASHSLQASSNLYECFNCGASWQVSPARFCRPYRRLKTQSI